MTRTLPPAQPQTMTIQQALALAYGHWNAGQPQQAEQLCQHILGALPEQPDALHLLGLLAHTHGNLTSAIDYLRRACRASRAPALFHSNLAEMYRQAGRLADGEAAARRALTIDPASTGAWTNLGIILQEADRLEESLDCLKRVVELGPDNPQAQNNLANTLQRLGRYDEAETHYGAAIALAPSYAEAHTNYGNLLKEKGEVDRAFAELSRAIELNPRQPGTYINIAGIALASGNLAEALRWLDNLASFAPDYPPGLVARATVLLAMGDLSGAERAARAAVTKAPESGEAREILARVLETANRSGEAPSERSIIALEPSSQEGRTRAEPSPPVRLAAPQEAERAAREALVANRPEQAEAVARAALAGDSGPLQLWALLAAALRQQGKVVEARNIQDRLVQAAPQNPELHFNLAESLLLLGEFDRGWREYRFRYSLPHTSGIERKVQVPRWEGQRINGKTLLIHDEQGFGDTFQFLRLVAKAKERSGARVMLQVSPEVLPFARRMAGIDALVVRGDLPPPFDLHCEMMSLPMAMGLELADLPGPVPYLFPDPARMKRWRKRLARWPHPRVALVWAGRAEHLNDANRSTSLATLAGLATEGVTFLSVQKGPKAIEAASPPANLPVIDLGREIGDFDDTAAILAQVDLLISVDSSPVHLAGALGRPAWVMLPFVPDWRWLTERADSPWYPSLRLFRQPKAGDWESVVRAMSGALKQFCQGIRS